MWTLSDRPRLLEVVGKRSLRAAALVLILGLPLVAWAVPALAAPQAEEESSESLRELRTALKKRYEVLPVRGGILLKSKSDALGVRTVEIDGDAIAVNGEGVNEGVLRAWLGDEADLVLRLAALDEEERREVLELQGASETPERAEAEEAPEAEETEEPGEPAERAEAEEAEEPAETPEAPEAPEKSEAWKRSSGSRVNLGGSVTVDDDELAEEVVAIGGSARVLGEVERDVVAIGGAVRIQGRVRGEVVSVGSGVYLGPKAVVEGNVTSVGGTIHQEPGARIEGTTAEVGFLPFLKRNGDIDWDSDFGGPIFFFGGWEITGDLFRIALLGLLACLAVLVARRPLDRVDRHLVAQPWKAGAVGFLAQLLFLPLLLVVTVLLAITIVGCALILLYPFLFLALILLAILGYAAVARRLGLWVAGRFGQGALGAYAAVVIGVVLIETWTLFGHLLSWGGNGLGFFGVMFLLFGLAVQYLAWTVGFGAMLLARFGTDPGYWQQRSAVPVPPMPPVVPTENLPLTDRLESPPAGWEDPGPPR